MACDEHIRTCPRCKHDVAHRETQCPSCGLPSQIQAPASLSLVRVLKLSSIGLLIVVPVGLFLMIVQADSRLKDAIERGGRPERAGEESLSSAAGCVGDRVVIGNKSSEHWNNVKIELNGRYTFVADFIPAGETMRYYAHIFTKSDGTRLNLGTTACNSIDIHADVNGRRQHGNYGRVE